MSCNTKGKRSLTRTEALPEPLQQIYARFPGISEEFSQPDLLALFEEFNSYTNHKSMNPMEFKLMMQSLNVGLPDFFERQGRRPHLQAH